MSDDQVRKHLLGLAQGSSENARAGQGSAHRFNHTRTQPRDGAACTSSTARRHCEPPSKSVQRVCARAALPHAQGRNRHRAASQEEVATQVKSVMHAAYQPLDKEGMAKLKQQAKWLATGYPDVAASLLEGLEKAFTVNRLRLTPAFTRCLAAINIIKNPISAVRRDA